MRANAPIRRVLVVNDDPGKVWRQRLLWISLWLASLGATYFVLRSMIAPQFADLSHEVAQMRQALRTAGAEKEQLQRELSQHQRGEQVAERANQELQSALATRQEEIASLRNDLGFYQRLMEGGAQQAGVSVHGLVVRPTDDPRAFQFALTLSQNLKRNRQASGKVEISITGANGQKSVRLGWSELGGSGSNVDFSFKYFQTLPGLIMLPEAFRPTAVRLRVLPEGSAAVEKEFMWKDVVIQGDT